MQIDPKTIPPEVVDAMAKAAFVYYKSLPWDECADKQLWRYLALAAARAMLAAWPLSVHEYREDARGRQERIILPIQQENSNG